MYYEMQIKPASVGFDMWQQNHDISSFGYVDENNYPHYFAVADGVL